jgi:type IV fimbrial biogenesis protein FimT
MACATTGNHRPTARRSAGFTLIELMTVLSVLVILSALAAPSFQRLLAEQRLSSATSAITALLWFARGATIKRNVPVSVEIAGDGPWTVYHCTNGAIVCDETDREVLQETTHGDKALVMAGHRFSFGPLGRLSAGTGDFEITDASGSLKRCLSVSSTGRTLIHRGPCP